MLSHGRTIKLGKTSKSHCISLKKVFEFEACVSYVVILRFQIVKTTHKARVGQQLNDYPGITHPLEVL